MSLPSRLQVPPTPLSISFASYDLYREARCNIIELQEGWDGAEDARSYIELGGEIMYDKSDIVSITGVDSLVLGQQIAVKKNDLDSLHWAGAFLDDYIGRESAKDQEGTIARVMACFWEHSRDDEDVEAWTHYYVGRTKYAYDTVSVEFLMKSLERARTPLLRCFAAFALGVAYKDQSAVEAYWNQAKSHALETGKEELVLYTMLELFNMLVENRMFQKAHDVQREFGNISSNFTNALSALAKGIVAFMEGRLKHGWGDTLGALAALKLAAELLKPLLTPFPSALVTYLCSSKDVLSFYGRACCFITFNNASTMASSIVSSGCVVL